MMQKRFLRILLFSVLLLCAVFVHAQIIQGTYAIKNVQTGMLLRMKDANSKNGTALVAYTPINWKCMTWEFRNVEGQTYQLKNLFTGKTFQPKAGTAEEGAELEQQPLSETQLQQYEFISTGKNQYLIRLKGTELYVTAIDEDGTINTGMKLAKKNGSKLQLWTIYEQHPTM